MGNASWSAASAELERVAESPSPRCASPRIQQTAAAVSPKSPAWIRPKPSMFAGIPLRLSQLCKRVGAARAISHVSCCPRKVDGVRPLTASNMETAGAGTGGGAGTGAGAGAGAGAAQVAGLASGGTSDPLHSGHSATVFKRRWKECGSTSTLEDLEFTCMHWCVCATVACEATTH